MYAVSSQYLTAIRSSHQVVAQVDVYSSDGIIVAKDIPISEGTVDVDGTSNVRRTFGFVCTDESLLETLKASGAQVFIRHGIKYPTSVVEWTPLGFFRIDRVVRRHPRNGISVNGVDRAGVIGDYPFLYADQPSTTNSVKDEIQRLVREAFTLSVQPTYYGGTVPTINDLSGGLANSAYVDTAVDRTFWQRGDSRWDAITELALSVGAEFFFDVLGKATLRAIPTMGGDLIGTGPDRTALTSSVWTVDYGPNGVLASAERETSRDTTYNIVTVSTSEGLTLAPDIYTVEDIDPESPTYIGTYGRVPYIYTKPVTPAKAATVANALLLKTKGLAKQVRMTTITNPALDYGDVITVAFPDGTTERHIIDGFSVPLGLQATMNLNTRSNRPELT